MSDLSVKLAEYILGDGAYATAKELKQFVLTDLPTISAEEWMRGFAIAEELCIVDVLMREPWAVDPFKVPPCRKAPACAALPRA